ncbi:MAG: hypothetical protein UR12_C0004G0006 [candidate division TM6 bacterium GW2011_GWF2_30_66]|nr:MAG: hypothetical protein UR12_C0004G0006 [candidate division TM6 bacterium GW2011_GWF2_30_66]
MKKIKILSLTLASLLLVQTTGTSCFFSKLGSIFSTKNITKPVKTKSFKLKKLVWPTIIVTAIVALYFATKKSGRADGSVDREKSGARIKTIKEVKAEEEAFNLENLYKNFKNNLSILSKKIFGENFNTSSATKTNKKENESKKTTIINSRIVKKDKK